MKNFTISEDRAYQPSSFQMNQVKKIFTVKGMFITMLVFFLSIPYQVNAQSVQDAFGLPAPERCVSNDLDIVSADLVLETCDCKENETVYAPLKIGIINNTESFRTSFSFWAQLEITDPTDPDNPKIYYVTGCESDIPPGNQLTDRIKYATFNADNPLKFFVWEGGDLVPAPGIDGSLGIPYTCGNTLNLINIYQAWTDASKNDSRQCGNIDPSKINPKCGISPIINIGVGLSTSGSTVDATCYGTSNGSLEISFSGGEGLYYLAWNGEAYGTTAVSSPVTKSNLAGSVAGTLYTWKIKDSSDPFCEKTGSATIYAPDQIDLALTPTNATCYGGSMSISAAVTGTPLSDLEINIDGGSYATVTSSPVNFGSLTAGEHTVVLRRISDPTCSVTKKATVSQPDELDLALTPTNATCYGGAMSISAAVTGTPLSDLEINIDGGSYATVTSSPINFGSLTAGEHTVVLRRISDPTCSVTKKATVSQPDELDLALTPTNATCYGGAMSISAAVTGTPLSDLEINIDGGSYATVTSSPVNFGSLTAGEHTVVLRRISDPTCSVTKKATVSQPDQLDLVLTPTDGTCAGGEMSISAAVTGTPLNDLEISIDGEPYATVTSSPVNFSSLSAGEHTVVLRRISDPTCSVTKKATVNGPTNCAHLFPTDTTCDMYVNGTGKVLEEVCVTVDGNTNTITNGTPGVFFFYGDIIAGEPGTNAVNGGNYEVIIDQKYPESSGMSPFALVNTNNVWVYENGCSKSLKIKVEPLPGGDTKVTFKGKKGYWYIISAKYDVKSLNGTTAPEGTQNYQFGILNSPSSYGGINVRDCSAPVSSTLAADDEPVKASNESPVEDSNLKIAETNNETSVVVNSFRAYPVPFRESLNVQYDFDYVSDATIQVFDMQGRLLSTHKEANASKGKITNLSINFRTLPSQVYVIKVITDRDVFTKKVISDK